MSPTPTTDVLFDVAMRASFSKAWVVQLLVPDQNFLRKFWGGKGFAKEVQPSRDHPFLGRREGKLVNCPDGQKVYDHPFSPPNVLLKKFGKVRDDPEFCEALNFENVLKAFGPLLTSASSLEFTRGSRLSCLSETRFFSFPGNLRLV